MATVTTVPLDTGRGDRYRIYAYVGHGSVRRATLLGSVSFTWIFQNRPKDCRYAVAGQWMVDRHAERFVVWDLYKVMVSPIADVHAPRPRLIHDDLDAAIMATAMLYEEVK